MMVPIPPQVTRLMRAGEITVLVHVPAKAASPPGAADPLDYYFFKATVRGMAQESQGTEMELFVPALGMRMGLSCADYSGFGTAPAAGETCVICLTEYEAGGAGEGSETGEAAEEGGSVAILLPCGHHFHEPCAEKWFERANTCPHCWAVVGGDVEGEPGPPGCTQQ